MRKAKSRRKRERERMTDPKHSSVMGAASALDEAHQRYLGLRLQLRVAALDIRRALSQVKRLTEPTRAPKLRPAYRPYREQPAEAAEQGSDRC